MRAAPFNLAAMVLIACCIRARAQTSLDPIHVVGEEDGRAKTLTGGGARGEVGALWDVTRAFASRPGVVGPSDRTTNLSVRGGDPTENLVRIDGVDVPSIGHMAWQGETGGAISMLSLGAIRDATFLTGAFPARYGGRMSSVLDIRLREGDRSRTQVSAELSPAGAAGVLSGPIARGRGAWIASYRAGLLDLVRRSAALVAVPSYRDAHAKVVYDVSPQSHLSAFALTGSSDIAVGAVMSDKRDEFASTKRVVGATWARRYDDGARTRLTLSDVRVAYDAIAWQPPILEPAYTNASTERRTGVEAAADFALSDAVDVTVGARVDRIHFSHGITSRPLRGFSENAARIVWLGRQDVDVDRVGHRVAAYVEASHSPAPRLRLDWGARAARLSLTGAAGVDPRLSVTYELREHTTARVATGAYRQSPTYLEMTLHEGNASLPDARATHLMTGLTHRPSESVTLAAEAYVKAYSGLRTLVDEGAR
ncbi:TonB-dependent receptor plug domain-containing protein, partial [Candidatus Poribacteria bacterium]|nr:TonB-dependent receptor plug domain-containing protein [Candidatus Poribacteria bacterium]